MIYKPKQGSMWDTSIIYREGVYYAFMMYAPEGGNIFLNSSKVFVATSPDGVHWEDGWVAADERDFESDTVLFKPQLRWVGDRFFMNQGVLHPGQVQDTLRFYESTDLKSWKHLGDSTPDKRWYIDGKEGRWDHMYILPKDENDFGAGFWGYLVAVPNRGVKSLGMMESDNGVDWRVLPPPEIEWGDIPQATLEIGGCERIGGKYVIIGGWHQYLNEGYSMYTLIADSPTGPFRGDKECFRLNGTTSKSTSMLAVWCRGRNNELLICNYTSSVDAASMLPLRKPQFDDGHLRLAWWPGNEALKGKMAPLTKDHLELNAINKREVKWLEIDVDLNEGFVLEGEFSVSDTDNSGAVGFSFFEQDGISMDIRLDIGPPSYKRQTTIGRHNDLFGYRPEDHTGPGCATVTGVDAERKHSFRMLVRGDLFELYVNDLYAQTYTWRPGLSRLGLMTVDAKVRFGGLKCHRMDL